MPSQAPSSIKATIGANLALARKLDGRSQREIARALDTTEMQISKWERGKHRPGDDTLMKLAAEYGRDWTWFLSEQKEAA